MVTAPTLTFSQSSSVLGRCAMSPLAVESHHTASKMLSAIGSSMSPISSLTETTGFMSPRRAGAGDGGGAGKEHADHASAPSNIPATAARPLPRLNISSAPRPHEQSPIQGHPDQ